MSAEVTTASVNAAIPDAPPIQVDVTVILLAEAPPRADGGGPTADALSPLDPRSRTQPDLSLDTPPPSQLDMQPHPLLDVPPPLQLDMQPHSPLDAPPPPQLDMQPDPPLDARPPPQLDMQPDPPLDAPPEPPLDAPSPSPPAGRDAPPTCPEVKKTEKVKRGQHVKGEPKACPGRQSWVHGTKLSGKPRRALLYQDDEALREEIRVDDQDLVVDVEDPPDSAADEVVHEVVSPEKAEFRVTYMKGLRTRISAWYRTEYGRLLKSDEAAFKELFTGVLDGAPPKPQRPCMVHFYLRKFYDERVKPHVEDLLAALARWAELAGEAAPRKIDVIARVTAERWEAETAAFKAECRVAMEREYEAAVKAWENSLADSPTQTAEERAV
ncbi:hypothetical protein C8R45DRAFT_1101270 [Mycena sanguinolenta]|nr:hypothetical protein C8R45DRAFT_1101270 [Mycena sanguinolenta]